MANASADDGPCALASLDEGSPRKNARLVARALREKWPLTPRRHGRIAELAERWVMRATSQREFTTAARILLALDARNQSARRDDLDRERAAADVSAVGD